MVEDLVRENSSDPVYLLEAFSEFVYSRMKAEKKVQIYKMNSKSILSNSNKILAKNMILSSANKYIQDLKQCLKKKEGRVFFCKVLCAFSNTPFLNQE